MLELRKLQAIARAPTKRLIFAANPPPCRFQDSTDSTRIIYSSSTRIYTLVLLHHIASSRQGIVCVRAVTRRQSVLQLAQQRHSSYYTTNKEATNCGIREAIMNTFGLVQTSNQSSAHVQRIESPLHRAQSQRRRPQRTTQGGEGSLKVPLFPVVLYGLLEDAEKHGNASIVSWRPSGVSFKVYKREEFVDKILPKYFKQTKFKSFVRQLNLWGFMCIERGQDKGSCKFVKCVRVRNE